MLVRDLLELIGDCDIIIIHCNKLHETWQGEACNMPLRYGDCKINKIFSTIVMYNKSALVITVNK